MQYSSSPDTQGTTGPRLAWLGLGNMGRAMVRNLVKKNSFASLLLYNRTTATANDLASSLSSERVSVSESIEQCVSFADIIFSCVGDDNAITGMIDTAIQGEKTKDKIFVDCSTVHPDTTDNLAATLKDAGADFVACPVFGAPDVAEAGRLVVALAGPRAALIKVRPFFEGVIARAVIEYSDQPQGNATRLKILGNTFVFHMIEALSEALVLAEKCGIGSDNLLAWIEVMYPGPYAAFLKRMIGGEYYEKDPYWVAKLARKDYRHAKSLADRCGVVVKGLDVAGQHLQDVIDYYGDKNKGDVAGVYGIVRREAGLEFENQIRQ